MKNLIYIFFYIVIFTFSGFSYAQPANDQCGDAIEITDLDGSCNTFNNAGATNNAYEILDCDNYLNATWFTFTAQGANVEITASGLHRPGIALIALDAGLDLCDPNDVISLECEQTGGSRNTLTIESNNNALVAGQEYLVMFVNNNSSGGNANEGDFTLCIDNPPAPPNDDCISPQIITNLDGTCTTGTTEGAGPDDFFGSCWSTTSYSNGGGTVWYSFVADGNTADVSVTGPSSSYPAVAVYSSNDICDAGQTSQFACAGIGEGGGVTTTEIESIYPLEEGRTYYVQVALRDGFAGDFDICIDNPPNAPGDNCLTAEPFCTDEISTFDAATDAVAVDDADYDCLLSQPNPKWFYLEIDDPGDMEITMSNTEDNDIDFALWGPVDDLESGCETGIQEEPVDCSYLTLTTEIGEFEGAQTGELYILVITNFENSPTTINVEQTDGSATTNCDIVLLPIELLSFDAFNIKRVNHINWISLSETNNDYFTVEHSTDGVSWVEIKRVKGQGTSYIENEYSIKHENYSVNEVNYYRLIQYDYDGAFENHGIRSVDNRGNVELIRTVNLLGQEVGENYKGIVIDQFSDGTSVKRIQ